MKIKSAVKRLCEHCYMVRRGKTLYVRCTKNPRHKQRQGFATDARAGRRKSWVRTRGESMQRRPSADNLFALDDERLIRRVATSSAARFRFERLELGVARLPYHVVSRFFQLLLCPLELARPDSSRPLRLLEFALEGLARDDAVHELGADALSASYHGLGLGLLDGRLGRGERRARRGEVLR